MTRHFKRVPDTHFTIDTAKLQRVMEERAEHKPEETLSKDDVDLFSAHAYPRLWKKLKGGHPAKFGKYYILANKHLPSCLHTS
jgi:hypothetical protein